MELRVEVKAYGDIGYVAEDVVIRNDTMLTVCEKADVVTLIVASVHSAVTKYLMDRDGALGSEASDAEVNGAEVPKAGPVEEGG